MVQWLGLRAFTAKGADSIPGHGTKIPQATQSTTMPPAPAKKENIIIGSSLVA